jgi:hypothetical protein
MWQDNYKLPAPMKWIMWQNDSIIQWLLGKIKYSYRFVVWCSVGPCHDIVRPQVTRGQNGLQIWKVTANMASEQPRIGDRGWYSRQAPTNHHCYDLLQTTSNFAKFFASGCLVACYWTVRRVSRTGGNRKTRFSACELLKTSFNSCYSVTIQFNSIRLIYVLTT